MSFHSSTCVGLLYGFFSIRSFWGSLFSIFSFRLHLLYLTPSAFLFSRPFFLYTAPLPCFFYLSVLSCFRRPPFPLLASLASFPSLLAFQLSIRVRLTQLTSLALLEPLDFRPFGFSPLFSLLMSTFLLLIASVLISPIPPSSLYRTLYYLHEVFFLAYRRFGHHLSLFYLWCNPSPIVRCYAFIIRMAASMPTAYVSSTSHSLPHFNGV